MLDESRCMLHNIILWHCTLLLFECQTARRLKSTPLTRLCCHPRCKRRLMRQNDWPIGLFFRGMAAGGVGDVTGWRRGSGLKYIYICMYNKRRPRWQNIRFDRFMTATSIYTHTYAHLYEHTVHAHNIYTCVVCVRERYSGVYIIYVIQIHYTYVICTCAYYHNIMRV